MTDVVGTPPKMEGRGAVERMPRVTVRMTVRQLRHLLDACHEAATYSDELEAFEYAAMASAFDIVQGDVSEECVYEIDHAPTVMPRW